jgi:hypothetical protein
VTLGRMKTRADMDAALKTVVVPALRKMGYTGSMPHLRRIRERVDLLTFQFDRYGGGFAIEVGSAPKEGITTTWGKFIPAAKLRSWDLPANQRPRLVPIGERPSHWFRYDDGQDCTAVAQQALAVLLAHNKNA